MRRTSLLQSCADPACFNLVLPTGFIRTKPTERTYETKQQFLPHAHSIAHPVSLVGNYAATNQAPLTCINRASRRQWRARSALVGIKS
jgi:hypothetical protein